MNYKRTMTFLLICSKQEGLQCTDREDDHPSSVPLGSASLAKLLEHRRGDLELYHSGESAEIATLIACDLVISDIVIRDSDESGILNLLRTSTSDHELT